MDLTVLLAYGICNFAMIAYYLFSGKTRYFELPFWFGIIGLGWFFPQAVGGYNGLDQLPSGYFFKGIMFATLCTVAMWWGYAWTSGNTKAWDPRSWLVTQYDQERLYNICAILCLLGFFFYFKLETLPSEMRESDQWSGAPVMYLFLSGMFKIGFIGLFILYLRQGKLLPSRYFILIPCFILMLLPVLLAGRRGEMMKVVSFTLIPLWFVRRVAIPRTWILAGLIPGIILINAIGLYRFAMKESKELPLFDRLNVAMHQDYLEVNKERFDKPGPEFEKYIYRMAACKQLGAYDYGIAHWNEFVFNYVPAQWLGRGFKQSLIFNHIGPVEAGKTAFNFTGASGATHTGYMDAFASFSYFGVVKFWIIGCIMGTLYKGAMTGFFLPQLLYAFALNSAMHSITHSTNEILVRIWIYFIVFGLIPFHYAKKQTMESYG